MLGASWVTTLPHSKEAHGQPGQDGELSSIGQRDCDSVSLMAIAVVGWDVDGVRNVPAPEQTPTCRRVSSSPHMLDPTMQVSGKSQGKQLY